MHSVANYNVNINNIPLIERMSERMLMLTVGQTEIKAVAIYMVSVYRDERESRLG